MWIYEALYNNIKLGLEGNLLYKTKTPFQDLKIYDTPALGRVLLLDNIVQTTEKDEFIYHEMMTHPVLLAHPKPEKVLIIGAGDGGILREVLKYPSVKEAYLIEIDEAVITVSKKYLPTLHKGAFENKRAKVIIADGAKFIKETKERFDVVIVDSSDPIGPATVLFTRNFYVSIRSILKEDGLLIRQTGSTLFQPREVKDNYKLMAKVFPRLAIQVAAIPTYIGGFFSFIIASKKIDPAKVSCSKISAKYNKLKLNTKYYNPEIHFASLKLPNYLKKG
ncbi:MAG: polyamine aminopropyltransferase [Candidatus Omnitrophota bacterium]